MVAILITMLVQYVLIKCLFCSLIQFVITSVQPSNTNAKGRLRDLGVICIDSISFNVYDRHFDTSIYEPTHTHAHAPAHTHTYTYNVAMVNITSCQGIWRLTPCALFRKCIGKSFKLIPVIEEEELICTLTIHWSLLSIRFISKDGCGYLYGYTYCHDQCLPSKLWNKSPQIPELKCFSCCLAVFFGQSIGAGC